MNGKLVLAPVICAFIGWMTNYLAIRMLFHPRRPIRIGFWTWQGLFPKRQRELAFNLGRLVEQELVNHTDVWQAVNDPAFQERLRTLVGSYVEDFLHKKLTAIHPMLAFVLKGPVIDRTKHLVLQEVERFIPDMVDQAARELESRLDFKKIVQEKVEGFSMPKLEQTLFSIMKREFWFIEIFGGVLGFVVGLGQIAFLYAWP